MTHTGPRRRAKKDFSSFLNIRETPEGGELSMVQDKWELVTNLIRNSRRIPCEQWKLS